MSLRRTALPLVLAASLSGCLSLGDKAELVVYAPQVSVTADEAWPKVDRTLAISEPNASALLDSNRIAVRPKPATLQVYSGAIWADSAPDLVQSALVGAFAEHGRFQAVVRPTDGLGADLLLRLDLRHFEAVYAEDAKTPTVVVELQATLVDQRTHRVIGSRRFRGEQSTEREKLPSVVPAFEAALGEVATAMMPWVLETAKDD
ncbi:ABC-type transport auxiliary lipoprotein family protein [Silanimonas sp.]|uniref:ABC-type transport auxiliary lipoprotein family protein n=1 Tax=Silanimonas sp. TaxID=1929290 RepID=UPI0037C8E766